MLSNQPKTEKRNDGRILLALLLVVMPWCALAQEAQTIKIGFSGPLSGALVVAGKDALNGMQMAIERLNQQRVEIGGKPVRFEAVIKDDKGEPQRGQVVARELSELGVKAVLGPFNSDVALTVSRIYEEAGIVSLTVASNPKVTQSGNGFVFRIAASDIDIGSKIARYAERTLKLKNVAIIDNGSSYGRGLIEEFQRTARKGGVHIVFKENVQESMTDFSALLQTLSTGRAEAIFFGGYAAQGRLLLQQIRQMRIRKPLLGGDALCTLEMTGAVDDARDDAVYCAQGGAWLTRVSDGAVFSSAYQRKFGRTPDVYAATFYDGMMLLVQAMKSANSGNPAVFAPVLAKLRYKGVAALYEFDGKHDLKESTVTILRLKAGGLTPLSSF